MSDVPETRTYIEYKLYKTKGAVALKPIPATIKLDGPVRTVEKDGVLLLEFAPLSGVAAQSAAAGGYGKKDYDYSKKEFFSLSVTELGDLIHMKETDSLNYVHTPNGYQQQQQQQGGITKRLTIAPLPDGKAVFFTLKVTGKPDADFSLGLMVTMGELEVIKSIARYCIPRFLGMDLVV
eukprot:CAMPEP_0170369762 /NCGR_PEP_ID=MMETSP0117_2-20130122/8155_1 /TAXON_ID=400756 /ORGANISM="Durinskia baltica, Strain CSIRO CS-38" /LENGTH=178 /DNA_ID=CAMNT_0010624501 /DNA_START=118 /DNA_END=654 /DNA_ORIENTATION=-